MRNRNIGTAVMNRNLVYALLLLAFMVPVHAAAWTLEEVSNRPEAEVEAALPGLHPAAYYVYATRLFDSSRQDEAIFWFYAGQLRYRLHLAANPHLPQDGDPALFASLGSAVGQPFNAYAGGDPLALVQTLGRVLAWDRDTPNAFTSKHEFSREWQAIRNGLAEFMMTIEQDADEIRHKREEAGLANRW
jgi:hypothetical protein